VIFAPVAQGIEHQFPVLGVGGSNPSRRTMALCVSDRPMNKFIQQRLSNLEHEHPGAMVLLFSIEGKYLYVNEHCRDVLGYEPDEVIGRPVMDFAAAEDIPHVEVTLQDAMLNQESIVVSIRVKTKSGQLRPVRGAAQQIIDPVTVEPYLMGWVQLTEVNREPT
jgi:PAS domain S-box-containing protein